MQLVLLHDVVRLRYRYFPSFSSTALYSRKIIFVFLGHFTMKTHLVQWPLILTGCWLHNSC